MWKCWYAVLCLCVVDTDSLQSVSGILPDIATLCPYNDFCHSKATKIRRPNELNLIPCCQMCSCEPDCQQFGNCCPDKKLTPGVDVIHTCSDIATYFNDPRGISASTFIDLYYRIVDKCPNAILDLAYPRCSYITEMEDFTFVSDPSTERVYKNKHCALCNGVANFTEWHLLTDCPSRSVGRNVEEWHSYIKEYCSIIPVPPYPLAGSLVRCYQGTDVAKSFRCNYTEKWETYDKDIDMACNTENPFTNNKYIHDTSRRAVFYENVYCKFCNKRHNELWPDLCENNLPSLPKRGGTSLMVFINFKSSSAEESRIQQRCDPSQIWNPFNESCMNVSCPSSTFLHKGTCERMYKRVNGDTYALFFRIISNNSAYTSDVLKSLHQTATIKIANTECEKCGTTFVVDDRLNYYLKYLVTTRDSCTEDFILSKVKNFMEDSPWFLHLENSSSVTMVCTVDVNDTSSMTFPLRTLNDRFCPIFNFVTWEMIDKCPRIPISYLDSFDSLNQIKTERHGTLCVNEYFEIMKSLHSSQMTAHAQVNVILSMVVILVFMFVGDNTM